MNAIHTAARMVPGHWFQGDLADGLGNRCGIGHLLTAVAETTGVEYRGRGGGARKMCEYLDAAAVDKFPERAVGVGSELDRLRPFAAFNDHGETTESEVVSVMELAAARWGVDHV